MSHVSHIFRFYPYHYSPYLSDLAGVAEMDIQLELSEPFCPFQQLMAVFPYGSSKLLPTVLQVIIPFRGNFAQAFKRAATFFILKIISLLIELLDRVPVCKILI